MAEDSTIPCSFVVFRLQKREDGMLEHNQEEFIRKLKPIPEDVSYSELPSICMKLAWLAHSRPDSMFEVSQMTQITRERFEEDRRELVKRVNRTVKYVQEMPACLRFPKLSKNGLQLLGISDASFASNSDSTSQLGYLCFFADDAGNVVPIHFKSNKARRITKSAMSAELMAFSDLFDALYTRASELRQLLPHENIPLKPFTDNKSLFDIISKGSRTSEKRLMIDIAAAREGFKNHEISDIGFVRSEHNIADGLMKPMKQSAMREMLLSGKFLIHVDQWIIRSAREGKEGTEDGC